MTVWTEHEARDLARHFAAKFPLKKDRHARAKTVLNDASLNTALAGRDLNVAIAVLAGHPQLAQKIGVGLVSIEVRPALHGTRSFYLTRADGTGTDFSYLKCLQPPTPRQAVHAACRNAIAADMHALKTYHLAANPTCAVTGLPIDASNSHVHHAPPMFDVLVDNWADTRGGHDTLEPQLIRGDNIYGSTLNDDDRPAWLTWHTQHANLQLVHRSANAHIEAARRAIAKAG